MGKVVDMTSKADIIVNAAFSDRIPLIQAILTGQRIYSETGRRSTLVHLSRTAHSLHQEESCFLQLHTAGFDVILVIPLFTAEILISLCRTGTSNGWQCRPTTSLGW
jgi:hypothetical protein